MRLRTVEISVGAFLVAGVLALVFLAVRVSGINLETAADTYNIEARFDDVAGLRSRARVSMAGVTIGRVTGIGVDTVYGDAIVRMDIYQDIPLTRDTVAAIHTEGFLGGRYVALIPGGDEELLQEGDTITDTQGAMVLETLIGEFLTNMGGS